MTKTAPQSPESARCRVVLVDDHPVVRAGLAALIDAETDLEVCGQAADARAGMMVVESTRPDVVLVDLSLGETCGLELIKLLVARTIKVLVVSMHADLTWIERSLAAGARGYVLKSEATSAIVEAVRRVMSGRTYVSEAISERMVQRMVGTAVRLEPHATPVGRLSDREFEILQQIGRGMTTRQIGERLSLSPKTVQTYRQRIKEKLGLETAAELATEATRRVVEQDAE